MIKTKAQLQNLFLQNSEKLCDTPWKFHGPKPRPMETPLF